MADSSQASALNRPSFSRFVFAFTFPSTSFEGRRQLVAEQRVGESVPLWQPSPTSESDLLQHVHEFLNDDVETRSSASRWHLTNDALQSREVFWTNAARWILMSDGVSGGAEIPFTFEDVQLNLFSGGVGLLSFTVRPEANRRQVTTPLETWWDLIHFFRFARGQRGVHLQAQRRTGRDSFEAFVPPIAQAFADQRDGDRLQMIDIISGLLQGLRLSSDAEQWWTEVFVSGQLMPYVSLVTKDVPDEDIPELIYRTRNFFNSRQDIRPLRADLDLDNHPGVLPYVDGAWFTLSLDGGAFVSSDRLPDTSFFTATLPEHIKNLYYVIFLLALYQRFALMRFSNEVAKVGMSHASDEQLALRAAALDEARYDFTAFTTRGYFTQVTQQEHHHTLYRLWQETFQIERLYDEVHNAVDQLSRYIQEAEQRRANELQEIANIQEGKRLLRQQRQSQFFSFITAVLAGPAFAISILRTTPGAVTMSQALGWTAVGLIVSSLAVWLYSRWLEHQIGG